MSNYNDLVPLFAGFFHQDWRDEFNNTEEALQAFVNDALPEELTGASTALQKLIQSNMSEEELGELMLDLGCFYNPTPTGKSYKQWLSDIAGRLASPVRRDHRSVTIRDYRKDVRRKKK
ncbi:MAG: hypothetical protein DMG65_22200 [Candidatus Angelobacter sp. Gp1-AA117]|nr:MAG: hypothetical protein DMG65_22200 [Candidatus Angelobacter sp. Gp1-AA117]